MLRFAAFLIVSAWLSIAAVPAGAQPVSDWRPLAVGALAAGATETIIDLRQARQGSEAIRLETPAVNGDTAAARIEIKSVELIYAGGAKVLVAEPFIIETGRPSQPIAERIADRKIDQIKITLARPLATATAIEVTGRRGPAAPADRPRVATSTRGLDAVPPPAPPTPSSSPAPDATGQAPPPAKPNTRGLNKQPAPTTRGGPVESRGAGAPAPVEAGSDACQDKSVCTPVPVFFGTTRARETDATRIKFGGRYDPAGGPAALGRAIVTVPRTRSEAGSAPERPSWYDIIRLGRAGAEDPAKVFTIPANGIEIYADPEAFAAALRRHQGDAGEFKDHAFVFVHGYNNTFDDALYRTAQISYDLGKGRPFGTAFMYSWPSGGLLNYVDDQGNARRDAGRLRDFIELVVEKSGAKTVHLIAHSMGNIALMGALEAYRARPNAPARIGQVILAAPDMDVRDFQDIAKKIKGTFGGGLTLYASGSDKALLAARQFYRGVARAGDVPPAGPVTADGIESIDVTKLSTDLFSMFKLGHSDYAEKAAIVEDMWLLMLKNDHPPDHRSTHYWPIPRGPEKFWRYLP